MKSSIQVVPYIGYHVYLFTNCLTFLNEIEAWSWTIWNKFSDCKTFVMVIFLLLWNMEVCYASYSKMDQKNTEGVSKRPSATAVHLPPHVHVRTSDDERGGGVCVPAQGWLES